MLHKTNVFVKRSTIHTFFFEPKERLSNRVAPPLNVYFSGACRCLWMTVRGKKEKKERGIDKK